MTVSFFPPAVPFPKGLFAVALDNSWAANPDPSKRSVELICGAEAMLGHPIVSGYGAAGVEAFPAVDGLVRRILFQELPPFLLAAVECKQVAASYEFWKVLASKGPVLEEARIMRLLIGETAHEHGWVQAVYPVLLVPYCSVSRSSNDSDIDWTGTLQGGYVHLVLSRYCSHGLLEEECQ